MPNARSEIAVAALLSAIPKPARKLGRPQSSAVLGAAFFIALYIIFAILHRTMAHTFKREISSEIIAYAALFIPA